MDQTEVKKQNSKRKNSNTSANVKKKVTNSKKETTTKQIRKTKTTNTNKSTTTSKAGRKPKAKTENVVIKTSNDNNVKKNKTESKTGKNRTIEKTELPIKNKRSKKISEMVPDEDINTKEKIGKIEKNDLDNEKDLVKLEEKIEEIGKNIKEKRKLPKKDIKEMRRKYVPNLIMGFTIIIFFLLVTLGFYRIQATTLITDLKTFGMLFLLLAIIILENAYNKKDKIILAYGIECIVIAIFTISLIYVYIKNVEIFTIVTVIMAAFWAIYYILKYFIIRRITKNNYFKDKMKEIIEKDEDVK